MSDSRIQQVLNEIEALKKALAVMGVIADDARTIVADMIDNSGGLQPHSDWYLQGVRNTLNTCINNAKRTLFDLETDVEWLQKLPENKAS